MKKISKNTISAFTITKIPLPKQSQVDRMIVLIDSLGKTLNSNSDFKQPKYDIIIMDELYSILEGWDSSLMAHKKLHLMTVFELLIRKV